MWYTSETIECNYYRNYKCASSFIVYNLGFLPDEKKYPFSFSIIRNPIERVESYMYMECKNNINYIEPLMEKILLNFNNNDVHSVPFTKSLPIKDLDFIGALENINTDIKKICNHLGKDINIENFIYSDNKLPAGNYTNTLNITDRKKYKDKLSILIRNIVTRNQKEIEKVYKDDIELYHSVINSNSKFNTL